MESVSFKLDAFEGPLDLLLHLISKHKLNIYDVEISLLLEQYLAYMNSLDEQDYEVAGDFLAMAAQLIYIKTVSLLPRPEEAEELRQEFQGRIIEYSICKQTAAKLREIYLGGDVFTRQPVKLAVSKAYTREHEPQVLLDIYLSISPKARNNTPLRPNVFNPIVTHRIVSVTSKIIFVLKRLYKTGCCEMTNLYDNIFDKSEKVATFLAILELTKSGRITLNEDNSEIYFEKKSKEQRAKDKVDGDVDDYYDEPSADFDNSVGEDIDNARQAEYDDNQKFQKAQNISDSDKVDKSAPTKQAVKFSSERIANRERTYEQVVILAPEKNSDNQSSLKLKESDVNNDNPVTYDANAPRDFDIADEIKIIDIIDTNDMATSTDADLSTEDCILDEFGDCLMGYRHNYWSKSRYFWGYNPTGCDDIHNYWKYGYKKR